MGKTYTFRREQEGMHMGSIGERREKVGNDVITFYFSKY